MSALYGLIGRKLGHSFSEGYFNEKFKTLGIDAEYRNFELVEIQDLEEMIDLYPQMAGFNVTIPYKTSIIPFLDEVESVAAAVGAVNTVWVDEGRLLGFNTDIIGFRDSLTEFYPEGPGGNALILGNGASAKSVGYVLEHFFAFDRIDVAARNPVLGQIAIEGLSGPEFGQYRLIVNTTPVGMHPHDSLQLPLPWRNLNRNQYLFDLIYNPERTRFLQHGEAQGCKVRNGMDMLVRQADAAWEIWRNH
jgi:shikimate dehydrogenase